MAPRGVAVAGDLTPPAVPAAVGDRVRLHVRGVASSGAGVADLPDGRVVFVHRTAPGDRVEARISRLRPRWGEASLLTVLEPAPSRVSAPCPRYGACGGCSLQHLAEDEQLRWKGRFVADALGRIGGRAVEPPEVVAAPSPFGYRNRVTFTVRRLRGGRTVAGFHALGDPDRIVDIGGECLLPEEPIRRGWADLRRAWGSGAPVLPRGREVRVTLRAVGAGLVVVVRGGAAGWDAAPLLEAVPGVVGVWHRPDGSAAAEQIAGGEAEERWGGDRIPVAGHAFLQVNRLAAEAMVAHVLEACGPPAMAVDAYSGVGIYGVALARKGWKVTSIEVDPDAVRASRALAPAGMRVVEGTVEERLGGALPADLVILNPPRTGTGPEVPGVLRERPPRRLVYVSCDPATLARDAARLGEVFRLTGLRSFDLFPQTAHVETVAVFTSDAAGSAD